MQFQMAISNDERFTAIRHQIIDVLAVEHKLNKAEALTVLLSLVQSLKEVITEQGGRIVEEYIPKDKKAD